MANIEFFDRTMLEAMSLLAESRRYLTDHAENDSRRLPVDDGLTTSMETMRLVARLTQVLAWVLTHRAVHNGEMSLDEAAKPERRLGGRDLCSKDTTESTKVMPEELQRLLARSLALYQRVARLDDQVGERASGAMVAVAGGFPRTES